MSPSVRLTHCARDILVGGTAVLGLGPAGLAVVQAARRLGVLARLAERGLCLVDEDPDRRVGSGSLGDYLVRSDTEGRVLIECCRPEPDEPRLRTDLDLCATEGPVPVPAAARLLHSAGKSVLSELDPEHCPVSVVAGRVEALHRVDGAWEVMLRSGNERGVIRAHQVVVATGGRPHLTPALLRAGAMHSDAIIRGTLSRRTLAPTTGRSPRFTIIGGSHSAFAAALKLLELDVGHEWEHGAITILHRSAIRVTCPSVEHARLGRVAFGPDDVCTTTGRVFRFGGLRGDAAELWRRVRSGTEAQVALSPLRSPEVLQPASESEKSLLIGATGYGARVAPLLRGLNDSPRGFGRSGELMDSAGAVVPGIFGIGLGAGRHRDAATGGEKSFSGNINGVSFYQQVVAPALVERLLSSPSRRGPVSSGHRAASRARRATTQRCDAAPSP